jgi:hypothetical protein
MLTVNHSTLCDNSTHDYYVASGGGILNAGTATVSDSTLSGNSASYYGGGISNGGTLTVSDSTLSGNSAFLGGGVYSSGTLTVSNSALSGNSAFGGRGGFGGGITNSGISSGGTLTVSNSSLSGNSATVAGGAIYNEFGTVTVSNSTLSGNSADLGGGILNNGTLTVSDSTLSGNSSGGSGGGIWNNGTGPVTLTNVTLTANRCGSLVSVHGGGLFVSSGAPVLHNTLIAGNFRGATGTTADDVNGPLDASGDYNLIGDGTGMTGLSDGVNGDRVGTASAPIDPLLGPLQNNGGPTQTLALLPGSPAINAGGNTYATATDQRGFARIVGGAIDIGAFEVQPAGQATYLRLQAPASITAGTPFTISVTALDDFGQPATGYTGTVHFTLTWPATAMHDYTFTAGDMGQHTFSNLMLPRAGAYTVAGADTADAPINGSTAFTVTPAAAAHIAFTVPTAITAGVPFALTVTVQDAYGNTVTGYQGRVHFTLTGPAMAQADYTFTATDMGSHTFNNVVLRQEGDYTLAGMDSADPTISGSTFLTVLV